MPRPTTTNKGVRSRKTTRPGSKSNPFDDLPADLNINYSQWFFGEIEKEKPNANPCCHVSKKSHAKNNPFDQLEMIDNKLLTQDLEPYDSTSIQKLSQYRLSLYKDYGYEFVCPNETRQKDLNEQQTHRNLPRRLRSEQLYVNLSSQILLIDRRPMLSKRLTVNNELNRNNEYSNPLIGPGEDCDDSDIDVTTEIDCDIEYQNAIHGR